MTEKSKAFVKTKLSTLSKILASGMLLTPTATLILRYGKRIPGGHTTERAVRQVVDPGILLMGMWVAGLVCAALSIIALTAELIERRIRVHPR